MPYTLLRSRKAVIPLIVARRNRPPSLPCRFRLVVVPHHDVRAAEELHHADAAAVVVVATVAAAAVLPSRGGAEEQIVQVSVTRDVPRLGGVRRRPEDVLDDEVAELEQHV